MDIYMCVCVCVTYMYNTLTKYERPLPVGF